MFNLIHRRLQKHIRMKLIFAHLFNYPTQYEWKNTDRIFEQQNCRSFEAITPCAVATFFCSSHCWQLSHKTIRPDWNSKCSSICNVHTHRQSHAKMKNKKKSETKRVRGKSTKKFQPSTDLFLSHSVGRRGRRRRSRRHSSK